MTFIIRTYQLLFFLIVLANVGHSFAQEKKKNYHPSELFVSNSLSYFTHIYFSEETGNEDKLLNTFFVSGPRNPFTNKSVDYLVHRKYQLGNGQIVSLDIISDSIFLFTEYVKSFDQKEDSIISSGRLKPSTEIFQTHEVVLLDMKGEDSLVIDTLFTYVPDGFWSMNIDNRLFEIGEYVDGKKEGEWKTIIAQFSERKNPPIVKTTEYKADRIVSTNQIDKSKDIAFLKKNLIGKWHNEGMDWKNMSKCLDKNICNDFYVKNINEVRYSSRLRGFYNHFSLFAKEEMEYIAGSACGTGISLEKSKWCLDKNGQLILNEVKWNVEYFTGDRLIISR